MDTEFKTNVRAALEKLAKELADAAELTVETRYAIIDPNNRVEPDPKKPEEGILAARTIIKLDGDQTATVPVTFTEAGDVTIEEGLMELHMAHVQAAIEYRNNALKALVDIVRQRGI